MMKELLEQAKKRPEKSKRYAEIVMKLNTHNKVPIPREVKRLICKTCKEFMIHGELKVRINSKNKTIVYECKKCGTKKRYGYSKEKN